MMSYVSVSERNETKKKKKSQQIIYISIFYLFQRQHILFPFLGDIMTAEKFLQRATPLSVARQTPIYAVFHLAF